MRKGTLRERLATCRPPRLTAALCLAADPAARRRPIHWALRLRRAPRILA